MEKLNIIKGVEISYKDFVSNELKLNKYTPSNELKNKIKYVQSEYGDEDFYLQIKNNKVLILTLSIKKKISEDDIDAQYQVVAEEIIKNYKKIELGKKIKSACENYNTKNASLEEDIKLILEKIKELHIDISYEQLNEELKSMASSKCGLPKEILGMILKKYDNDKKLIATTEESKNLDELMSNITINDKDLYDVMKKISCLTNSNPFFNINKQYELEVKIKKNITKINDVVEEQEKIRKCYNYGLENMNVRADVEIEQNQINRIKDARCSSTKMVLMHVITGQGYKFPLVGETIELTKTLYKSTHIDLTE